MTLHSDLAHAMTDFPCCPECDGTGFNGNTGTGWHDMARCHMCDGSGWLDLPEPEPTQEDLLARQADAENDERWLKEMGIYDHQ